ncbi:MAG: deoxyribodipyrimidine photo-lyase, partial [Bacteroidia bacterium]
MKDAVNIFWFRRDLRLEDNAGLWHALQSDKPVLPVFIFDIDILNKLEDRDDARVSFIHGEIERLDTELKAVGSGLYCHYGKPV